MDWLTPPDAGSLAELLREGRDRTLLPTGAPGPPDRLPGEAEPSGVVVVSTAELAGVEEIRPRDLTVTAGAGTRVADLQRACRERDVWLPLGGPAADRSLGGAVGAATPGPWDASHGDLRRQLLACELVTWAGDRARWGRDVMKNVAGYGLTRLVAGAFDRLGVVHRVTIRLWPEPRHHRVIRITGPGGSGALEAADRAARGDLDAAVRPDAVVWSRSGSDEELAVHLLGGADSVDLRAERLGGWARDHEVEILDDAGASEGGEAAAGDPGPGAGDDVRPRSDPRPASGPGMRSVSRERPPGVSVVTLAGGRTGFAAVASRATGALDGALVAAEGYPLGGEVRLAYRRTGDPTGREATPGQEGDGDVRAAAERIDRLLEGLEDVPVRVERGTAAELDRVRRRRPAGQRSLEERVVEALDGRPRSWLSGYL